MKKISVYTVSLGCPKNQVDTEFLLGCFGANFQNAVTFAEADVILINTCSFIRPAVDESIATILNVADEIADLTPRPKLVVTGCLVSRYGTELVTELPEVDFFVPIGEQKNFAKRLEQIFSLPFGETKNRLLGTAPGFAYLKIAEGCNNRCRFCVIPEIRGALTSRLQEEIMQDARFCLQQGRKELVVVAQDVTAYGEDLEGKNHLQSLLKSLVGLNGLRWLRLMYLYPAGLTADLLSFLVDLGRPFLPYFDIPLQHSHAEILKNMGRPFRENPRAVLSRVRRFFPKAALRTSLIVGYPGESEAMFRDLEEFVREAKFTQLGVFPYYAEDGSPAAKMDGQVAEEVKQERLERIMQVQAKVSEEFLQDFEGQEMEVLVDGRHEEWEGLFVGRTWFQAPEVDGITYVSGDGVQSGKIVQARIEEAKTYDLVSFV